MWRPKKVSRPRHGAWYKVFHGCMIAVDVLLVLCLVATAYAGHVSPLTHNSLWGLLPLAFPVFFWLTIVALVVQLFFCRYGSALLGLGILLCGGPALEYCPLNLVSVEVPSDAEKITVLQYNVHNFVNMEKQRGAADSIRSAVDYILEQDADIVAIQEGTWIDTPHERHLSASEVQRVFKHYEYVYVAQDIVLLSKFKAVPINIKFDTRSEGLAYLGAWRITLPSGREMAVFNVHLHSMGLHEDDRELYENLTKGHRPSMETLKEQLVYKLRLAAVGRAENVEELCRYIKRYGGRNVLVLGDFNDVTNSYAGVRLRELDFESVHSSIGLGPQITFNDRRIIFGIDHAFYRGDLVPFAQQKGKVRYSDHFPLLTEFYISDPQVQ